MTVNLWYPEDNLAPPGLGYLIPASVPHEDNPERALGVFFDSNVGIGSSYDNSQFERGSKFFVLMGGHLYDRDGVEPPSEAEAIEQAKSLLERHLGIPRDTPCHAVSALAPNCLPQHNVGHAANIDKLSEQLKSNFGNRLAVAGGSFGRPGVVPAARQGWDISFGVSNVDFLTNGLEEYTQESVLRPTFVRHPPQGFPVVVQHKQ